MEEEVLIHSNYLLNPLTPDQIDDFVTWSKDRFCIHAFSKSDPGYKKRKVDQFLKETNPSGQIELVL